MSTYIDPETIGEKRPASAIRTGWHVDGALALGNALYGPDYVAVNVKLTNGCTEPRIFRTHEYVFTRTPAEQVAYIEACHRQLVAQASIESAVLSARPVPPCMRPECCATRAELGELRRRRAASLRTAPVPVGVAR